MTTRPSWLDQLNDNLFKVLLRENVEIMRKVRFATIVVVVFFFVLAFAAQLFAGDTLTACSSLAIAAAAAFVGTCYEHERVDALAHRVNDRLFKLHEIAAAVRDDVNMMRAVDPAWKMPANYREDLTLYAADEIEASKRV